MKTLEEEAADYAENVSNLVPGPYIDFIAGANSKWVQAEKIKAQIEIVKAIGDLGNIPTLYGELKMTLIALNKQLKDLEDESKTN